MADCSLVLIKCSVPYEAEEGCLSLVGTRKVARYESIKVKYQDCNFKTHTLTFNGWVAQIIEHEIDHCNGIIISDSSNGDNFAKLYYYYFNNKQNKESLEELLKNTRKTMIYKSL